MAPRIFTPPTPSPSNGRTDPESLYATPVSHASPRRARVSPPPSVPSSIRTTASLADEDDLTTPRALPVIVRDADHTSDFLTLHVKAQQHTHAFRIHSPNTAPDASLVWSGVPGTSGFFPYNAHLHVPPPVYIKTLARVVETPGWEHGPYVRHTMVDHINGKMRQGLLNIPSHLEERPGTPEDEKSAWISGTRSLMWAVWEIARRLAWDEGVVGFAVIKRESVTDEAEEWEEIDEDAAKGFKGLEAWRKANERKSRGYVAKEVMISPLRPIATAIGSARAGDMSVSMKEAYETALRAARESEEVLWYGRVFAESVERNVEFSAEILPFELPQQFYKPRKSDPNRQQLISPAGTSPGAADVEGKLYKGWLGRLVWDPRSDEYERAVQKVVERRRQLYISRGVVREDCPLTPI